MRPALPISEAKAFHQVMNVQNVLDQKAGPTFRDLNPAGPSLRPAEVLDLVRPAAERTPAAVISIKGLCVTYRGRGTGQPDKQAVKELTLNVQPGEVFGFLGPNGAGKTTTMNVLLGFANATSGDAWLFGANVREPIARQRIGYLPELTYYYKFLTAEELLRFYARIFGIPKPEAERRIDAVLKLVELETVRKRLIKSYSKGMQQRIGLAQALINDPDLLILDEPTSGLDPIGRMKVREIIQRLKNEGRTVFFSSHELGEVETVCDRVAILHQGGLKVEGRVADLVKQHRCNLEQLFLKVIGYQPQP
jgi:ABC-2 type transport system ATP-binding protein